MIAASQSRVRCRRIRPVKGESAPPPAPDVAAARALAAFLGAPLAHALVLTGVRSLEFAVALGADVAAFRAALLIVVPDVPPPADLDIAYPAMCKEVQAIARVRRLVPIVPAVPVVVPFLPVDPPVRRVRGWAFPHAALARVPRPSIKPSSMEEMAFAVVLWVGQTFPGAARWIRLRDSMLQTDSRRSPTDDAIATRFVRTFRSVLFAAESSFRRSATRGIGIGTLSNRIRGLRAFCLLAEAEEVSLDDLTDIGMCSIAYSIVGSKPARFKRIRAGIRWGERVFELGLEHILSDPAVDAALSGTALAGDVAVRGPAQLWPDALVCRLEAIAAGRVESFSGRGYGLIAGALLFPGFGGVRWAEGRSTFSFIKVDRAVVAGAARSKTVERSVVYPVVDMPLDPGSRWLDRYLEAVALVMGDRGFRVFPAPVAVCRVDRLADPVAWTSYFDDSLSAPGASWRTATKWLRFFAFAEIPDFPIEASALERLPAPHGLRPWLTTALGELEHPDSEIARVMHWRSGGPDVAPMTVRSYDRSAIATEIRIKLAFFRQFQLGWRRPPDGAHPAARLPEPIEGPGDRAPSAIVVDVSDQGSDESDSEDASGSGSSDYTPSGSDSDRESDDAVYDPESPRRGD